MPPSSTALEGEGGVRGSGGGTERRRPLLVFQVYIKSVFHSSGVLVGPDESCRDSQQDPRSPELLDETLLTPELTDGYCACSHFIYKYIIFSI